MQMFQTLARTMANYSLLHANCGACNHTKTFSYAAAVRAFGPDAKPWDVRDKLVCSKCGERQRINIWIA